MVVALAILTPMRGVDGRPIYLPSGRRRFAGTRFVMREAGVAEHLCQALDLSADLALLLDTATTTVEVDLERLREAQIDPEHGAVNGRPMPIPTCVRLHAVRQQAEQFGARAFLEAE